MTALKLHPNVYNYFINIRKWWLFFFLLPLFEKNFNGLQRMVNDNLEIKLLNTPTIPHFFQNQDTFVYPILILPGDQIAAFL